MRLLVMPIVALGLITVDQGNEPNELAMRTAFEATLRAQVQGALEFVAETAGAEGVARVRDAGTDRFDVQRFRKLECTRDEAGHVCNFAVEIAVVTGTLQHTVKGRFLSGPHGRLVFTQDI